MLDPVYHGVERLKLEAVLRGLPAVRVGLNRISSQLPFLDLGSDVTFITFSGDKKCDVSHLSHFWEECDALAHENTFFKLVTFFVTSFPKNVTFWPRRYNFFLSGNKCDYSAG